MSTKETLAKLCDESIKYADSNYGELISEGQYCALMADYLISKGVTVGEKVTVKEETPKGFVVFGCRKCDHRVYAEQAPNFHDKLYKLSGLACPSCGEEGLENWVLLGTADEYEGTIYASKPIQNEEREARAQNEHQRVFF
jgi:DNA-directed RNA polymerase subunit RPC12/RpoP